MAKLHELSARDAADRIAKGEITSEALVDACATRLAAREDVVGAWAALRVDAALEEARERDRERPRGPLHGIPFGVKDIIDTADLPTGFGSAIFEGRRPTTDAPAVRRLREAGGVLLGKNVTTEFAYFGPGKTRNPHDPERTPGGSSSGSAAAVADFMVPLSLGTQAAGSTIRPASFCGVVGFKPSHESWDMTGALRLYPSLDTLSVFARTVEDAALVDSVLGTGPTAEEAVAPPRIALYRPVEWIRAEAGSLALLEEWAERFAVAGARVDAVEAPAALAALVEASDAIIHYEAGRNAGDIRPRLAETSAVFQELMARADAFPREGYLRALETAAAARAAWETLMADFDAALTLAVPGEAPIGLASTGDPVFIRTFNVLKVPSINLPVGRGPAALPLGVQLAGRFGRDRELISAALWLSRRTGLPGSPRPTPEDG